MTRILPSVIRERLPSSTEGTFSANRPIDLLLAVSGVVNEEVWSSVRSVQPPVDSEARTPNWGNSVETPILSVFVGRGAAGFSAVCVMLDAPGVQATRTTTNANPPVTENRLTTRS